MNKFFENSIESKFIKNMIYNTPIPNYNSVQDGDFLVKGINYIYDSNIIECIKNGILNFDSNYDNAWVDVNPFFTLYTPYDVGTYFKYDYPILSIKDSHGTSGQLFRFNRNYTFLQDTIIIKVQKIILNSDPIEYIDLVESADYEVRSSNNKINGLALLRGALGQNEYLKIIYCPKQSVNINKNNFSLFDGEGGTYIEIDLDSNGISFLNEDNILSVYIVSSNESVLWEYISIDESTFTLNRLDISSIPPNQINSVIINYYIPNYVIENSYYEILKVIPSFNNLDVFQLLEDEYIKNTTLYEINKADYKITKKDFFFGKYYPQYTYKYISNDNYYDSKTHRFLGDYLRCYKNIWKTDLMTFYNCFNEEYTDNFYIDKNIEYGTLDFNQISNYLYNKDPSSLTVSISSNILKLKLNKNSDSQSWTNDPRIDFPAYKGTSYSSISLTSKHKYFLSFEYKYSGTIEQETSFYYVFRNKTSSGGSYVTYPNAPNKIVISNKAWNVFSKIIDNSSSNFSFNATSLSFRHGFQQYDEIGIKNYIFIDLTEIYGAGNEPQTVQEFKEKLYQEYYPYTPISSKEKIIDYTDIQNINTSIEQTASNIDISNFKVLKIPVKLNKKYTIALDSQSEIRLGCAFLIRNQFLKVRVENNDYDLTKLYNEYKQDNIQLLPDFSYANPILYNTENKGISIISTNEDLQLSTLFQLYEKYFYLLIQVPKDNSSSVVVLEGDYTNQNCRKYMNIEEINKIPNSEIDKNCLSGLSLLQFNDTNNYCYSPVLIEYLLWNVIDNNDEIMEDVESIQNKYNIRPSNLGINYVGYWSKSMRPIIYNKYRDNKKSSNIDITGYVDKKIENS